MLGWLSTGRLRFAVAVIGVTFVIAIAIGASGVLVPKNQRVAAAASTTITIISGGVSVRHGTTGDFTAVDDGTVLGPGDTIRTSADARAVLTYFEGSTVEIEPSSELTINEASAQPDGSTQLSMTQNLGATWHVVTHLVTAGSKYEVKTPASTASVRGTQFGVQVAEDQTTTIATSEGLVATSDPQGATSVNVAPGLQTTTRAGEKPAAPVQQPEPQRKVTVTVTDQNTLVVDPLGRANGFKDGRLVAQTPGAIVKFEDGKLVISLPNVPDGTIAAHVDKTKTSGHAVTVTTVVADEGSPPATVTATVTSSDSGSTGVKVSKGSGRGTTPTLQIDNSDLKPPKSSGSTTTQREISGKSGAGHGATSRSGTGDEGGDRKSGNSSGPSGSNRNASAGHGDSTGKAPGAGQPLAANRPPARGFVPNLPLPGIPGIGGEPGKNGDIDTADSDTGAAATATARPRASGRGGSWTP